MSDARHILQNHYKDASRLDTRIQLHAKYSQYARLTLLGI